MSLWLEVLLLAMSMAICPALPLFVPAARRHSRSLFLIGTGAMLGICFFDLVPDVLELGGSRSLWVMGLVWLAYSVVHLFHIGHHHHDEDGSAGFPLFLGSVIAHCFASGMLLTASFGLSEKVASTVFFALFAHKIYESLLLASVILAMPRSNSWRACVIALYAAALPAGAAVTSIFEEALNQRIAVLISSVAVGTLLGCLIFDFVVPSVKQLREQTFRVGWILFGLGLTQLVMRQL